MRAAIIVIVVVILLAIFGPATLFTVDETQLVVVTQFGDIKAIHTTPGLKAKVPFVQKPNRFDKRVLRIDMRPAELNDIDKFILVIDAYTRYQITDVRKFFEKLRTQTSAEERIGSVITSNLKEEVAKRKREEIIGAKIEKTPEGVDVVIPTNTRQEILAKVLEASNREVGPPIEIDGETTGKDFGVKILDVRIKRADFSEDIREDIFNRMRAERERISRETRALGREQDAKIRAAVDKDRAIILANAQKQADLTRGEGEARAIEIFAEALEQDPEFFAFQRSLQAYKKFLSTNTTVVLSSDAELFQFLEQTEFISVQRPKSVVGTIEVLEGNLWTVGGTQVQVDGSTVVELISAPSIGDSVFVEGAIQQDGGIQASQVTEGVSGLIERISIVEIVVDDQIVVVDEATDIQIDDLRLVAAVYVEIDRAGGVLRATQITEGVRGTLETIVGNIWTVGTTDVIVDNETEIEEGSDQIGENVLVPVTRGRDQSLTALKTALQQPAETAEKLAGPVGAVTRQWKVSGSDEVITVDEHSNIQLGADQVGLVALIGFKRQADGSLLALEVRTD